MRKSLTSAVRYVRIVPGPDQKKAANQKPVRIVLELVV